MIDLIFFGYNVTKNHRREFLFELMPEAPGPPPLRGQAFETPRWQYISPRTARQSSFRRLHPKRMDTFEQLLQLYQDDDEDAVYLCHDCNSVIIGHDSFDQHQCKERITCPGCYDICHTPEDYADYTCTNERRPQLDDEPRIKKAKDIITCPGCIKVFNTLESYADHPCMSRQYSTK